jgi:hypothetical protein
MKRIRFVDLWRSFGLILFAGFFQTGCMPGVSPERKKMPGYLQYDAFESNYPFSSKLESMQGGLGFATEEVDLSGNGKNQHCIAVPLPDASFDAMVISMFESYKMFAIPLLTEWGKQNRNGVILDLRANREQTGSRSDYMLEKSGEFSIPVMLIWDEASANRAHTFTQMLQNLSGINFIRSER